MKLSYKIKEKTGLHGRIATKIVNKCKEFESDVSIVFNGRIGETDSIVSIVSIGAKQGDVINVIIDGSDEVEVYKELKLFIKENL